MKETAFGVFGEKLNGPIFKKGDTSKITLINKLKEKNALVAL